MRAHAFSKTALQYGLDFITTDYTEGDIVYINGYGFPEVTGGPMFWADQIGLDNILTDIKAFQAQYGGDIWQPAPLLERLVEQGKSFASLQS